MSSRRAWLAGTGVCALLAGALPACAGDLTVPGSDPQADPGGSGAGLPALLQAVAGDGQRAETGQVLDQPLAVRVLDEAAQPLAGVAVRFGFLGDAAGAALDPAAVLTDAEGRAEAIVRLGDTPGEQVIVAAVDNTLMAALRATFTATALPAHGGGHGHGHGDEGN
jgi:hypothetical protein